MEECEVLQKYRSVNYITTKALRKEIIELGESRESEAIKKILFRRKKELEAVLVCLQEDMER